MKSEAAATVATPMYAQPVLIRYDETTGRAINEAEVRELRGTPEDVLVPWKEWKQAETSQRNQVATRKLAEMAAVMILSQVQMQYAAAQDPEIDVIQMRSEQGYLSKVSRVVARADLKPHELVLPPHVPTGFRLKTESASPDRLVVSVISKWGASGDMEVLDTTNFFIHPEFITPQEETVEGKRAWEWTGKETMSPMGAVARYTEHNLHMINVRDKTPGRAFNMNVQHRSFSVVGVGGHGLSDGACS